MPLIVCWPGVVRPGTTSDPRGTMLYIAATMLDVAAALDRSDAPLDRRLPKCRWPTYPLSFPSVNRGPDVFSTADRNAPIGATVFVANTAASQFTDMLYRTKFADITDGTPKKLLMAEVRFPRRVRRPVANSGQAAR